MPDSLCLHSLDADLWFEEEISSGMNARAFALLIDEAWRNSFLLSVSEMMYLKNSKE